MYILKHIIKLDIMDKFIPIKISDVGSKFKVGGGGGETYRYIDKQKKITKKRRKDYGNVQLCPKSWGSKHSLALSPLNPPPLPPIRRL